MDPGIELHCVLYVGMKTNIGKDLPTIRQKKQWSQAQQLIWKNNYCVILDNDYAIAMHKSYVPLVLWMCIPFLHTI